MKTIRPLAFGVTLRPFRSRGEQKLAMTGIACLDLATSTLVAEPELWKIAGEVLGPLGALDEGMPKPRGELLVGGSACSVQGPTTGMSVGVRVGDLEKELLVIGDREWGAAGPSDPAPFETMRLDWSSAFGGPGVPDNPLGKGIGKKLPNVEVPARRIRSERDRPPPGAFLPIDPAWPIRASKTGSFSKRTKDDDPADMPPDFDPSYWNVAPLDQRMDGFFRGDETFQLTGMHPTRPRIEGALPSVVGRVFIVFQDNPSLVEVPMHLETLWFFPDRERAGLLFRGIVGATEDDTTDVRYIVGALEDRDQRRPVDHYRAVLARRVDDKKGALAALADKELLPEKAKARSLLEAMELEAFDDAPKHVMQDRQRARATKGAEQARERLRAAGMPEERLVSFDAAEAEPDVLSLAEQGKLGEHIRRIEARAAEAEQLAKRAGDDLERSSRARFAARGLDYDEVLAKAREASGGPPSFRADEEIDRLEALATLVENAGGEATNRALLGSVELRRQLEKVERDLFSSYRRFAHHFPEAPLKEGALRAMARARVIAAMDAEEPMRGWDLTRADLHGLDLGGCDLREALLEGADLTGARLAGADVSGAVLARAVLDGADLSNAKLVETNFGKATMRRAKLDGADISGATFWAADLSAASLCDASLGVAIGELPGFGDDIREQSAGTGFWDTKLGGAKLRGLRAPRIHFLDLDLRGVDMEGADLSSALFLRCDLGGANLARARLDGATLAETKADEAGFAGAKARGLRMVHGTTAARADFTGADLTQSNLRSTLLRGATFTDACLERSDISGADLGGAVLRRARARGAVMVRTRLDEANLVSTILIEGILQKASLRGTDLRGANLFRADMAFAVGDDRTSMTGAHVHQARTLRRRP